MTRIAPPTHTPPLSSQQHQGALTAAGVGVDPKTVAAMSGACGERSQVFAGDDFAVDVLLVSAGSHLPIVDAQVLLLRCDSFGSDGFRLVRIEAQVAGGAAVWWVLGFVWMSLDLFIRLFRV